MKEIITEIQKEIDYADSKFPPFHSSHEGFCVLNEEVDELWDEVKRNRLPQQRGEAIQVAAMAIKFIRDCCDSGKNNSITE